MNYVLLLGAGFSRNWGGWLAPEAFEYLLGTPQISNEPAYRALLWKHFESGGFENAIAEVQAAYKSSPHANQKRLDDFQFAVVQMFADMNRRFRTQQAGEAWPRLELFLDRFDAIFTLNQDLLLEMFYLHRVGQSDRHRKWKGAVMPGVGHLGPDPNIGGDDWAQRWEPEDSKAFSIPDGRQPFFKLHGSSNWFKKGQPLLILGGRKAEEIRLNPVLDGYFEALQHRVGLPDTRLMVIGYGFRDSHVNAVLRLAAEKGAMQMFVIDPAGSGLARSINETRTKGVIGSKTEVEELFEVALIGASRRPLKEIFGGDMIEYDKVEQFFR